VRAWGSTTGRCRVCQGKGRQQVRGGAGTCQRSQAPLAEACSSSSSAQVVADFCGRQRGGDQGSVQVCDGLLVTFWAGCVHAAVSTAGFALKNAGWSAACRIVCL
jgi:hypothetical protein